ncbi:MAG: UDP-N-acetylmuramate dehydrogenase [Coriobacteriales bacterium]|nr:UDP-N-acetylmuramate dehydrogenase [Coriobacteriales bacterium]
MSEHTTFRIGGPADYFATPNTVDQIRQMLLSAKSKGLPVHVMGLGSNLLVSDDGVRGVVIQLAEGFSEINVLDGGRIHAQAGASNEAIAKAALEAGLTGYEFASGIPGSVGGAAIMNAGAYDGEFKDVCAVVYCMDLDGNLQVIVGPDAGFGYRRSIMAERGLIVIGVMLQLQPGDKDAIAARMAELKQRREEKQPLEMPSAGSTFKRPEGAYAGKLIQDAGLKGYTIGGAQVSTKHSGFIVNAGGATAADVRALIRHVQQKVQEDSGYLLEPEVRMWGFDD